MSKCYYRSSVTNWCMQCTPTRKPTCLYLFSSSQHHLHSFPHHPPFFKPGEPCKCALGKPGGVLFLSLSLCLDPAIHGVMLMLRQRVCVIIVFLIGAVEPFCVCLYRSSRAQSLFTCFPCMCMHACVYLQGSYSHKRTLRGRNLYYLSSYLTNSFLFLCQRQSS